MPRWKAWLWTLGIPGTATPARRSAPSGEESGVTPETVNVFLESAYWDPVNFEAHTLRLEYRQEYREHLTFGAEGALSYSPKSSGLSKSAFLSAAYKFTEKSSLRCDLRWFDQNKGVERQGETDRYWAANYTMVFQHGF